MQEDAARLQVLVIQIWSEQDLSSLHTLEVREDDFQALKLDQGILVDFGGFPAKIITLLQRCLASSREDPPRCDNPTCSAVQPTTTPSLPRATPWQGDKQTQGAMIRLQ